STVKKCVLLTALLTATIPAIAMSKPGRVEIPHVNTEINVSAYDDKIWSHARPIEIDSYWSGEIAPSTRRLDARLLWSDTALYVRFAAEQHEPLVVSESPDLTKKTSGLWNRDVCEIFIAPDPATRNKYFEFEVAPTGEWVDLAIHVTHKKRLTDLDYASGMETFAKIDPDKVFEVVKIPFKALGHSPKIGDVWLGNLFRCVGAGKTRGYLAWRPTRTAKPSFHVPSALGEFEFKS
ncbi:MAG TPA: carbohydrate-binding family 9-like protein, partial [Pyrinomonadaceae bacterium]